MRLIKPKVELINQEPGIEGLFKHMELCARTCYKSEDKITEDSAKKFINNVIIARGHTAMLEHGTVYLRYDFKANDDSNPIAHRLWSKYNKNQYSEAVQAQPVPGIHDGFVAITTNCRVLLQNGWLEDLQYLCGPTEYHVKRVTVRFICDMGVAREFCRHRLFSFAQESTRYCNYSKAKFGKELNCIIPCWYKNMFEGNSYNIELCHTYDLTISEGLSRTEAAWIQAMCEAESTYFGLLTEGEPAQQARNVLPLALKTELIMTGTVEQWIEFLKLRCANDAHPQARELAIELRDRLLLDDYIDIDAEGNLQVSKGTRRYKRELHKEEAKLLDYKMHLVIRFILFLKYLITFRMQDAKDALDMDKELSKEEEALLRKHLANFLRREPYVRPYPKIGRNAPCPCGSGKKYKHCCGR